MLSRQTQMLYICLLVVFCFMFFFFTKRKTKNNKPVWPEKCFDFATLFYDRYDEQRERERVSDGGRARVQANRYPQALFQSAVQDNSYAFAFLFPLLLLLLFQQLLLMHLRFQLFALVLMVSYYSSSHLSNFMVFINTSNFEENSGFYFYH